MTPRNSAIASQDEALSAQGPAGGPSRRQGVFSSQLAAGLFFGFIGVLSFSFTLPMTRVAVKDLDPLFVGSGRAVAAGGLAIIALALARQNRPRGRQWIQLAIVAVGVVAGFPLLTSYALRTAPAAHGAVVIGLLPAATAIVAVIRTKERPSGTFWAASVAGVLAVVGFIALAAGGLASLHVTDLLLLAAVVLAALGYAEGGILARELGSWQTICWALVIALPVMLPLAAAQMTNGWPHAGAAQWLSFGYLAGVSMFLGFFAWYHGLKIGPISRISQVQLIQPVLTILWSAWILKERFSWVIWFGAVAVVLCAGTAVRARIRPKPFTIGSFRGEG